MIIGAAVGVLFKKLNETEQNSILTQQDKKIGEITAQLESEKAKKDEFIGKNKQLFVQLTRLEAENAVLNKKTAKFEAEERKNEQDLENKIKKLDVAQQSLEDEKMRIRREDAERERKEMEERDRMWGEHENKVKTLLTEICQKPEYNFATYDNNNLPDGFDGKLKPDFMIEFLGQYIIFDAKTTKADNLQTYISGQIKSTTLKIKGDKNIYPVVFFVVPTDAISSLKTLSYYEQGYTFFIISPESLSPIIASLRKIKDYEFAEKMDPEERENIVKLIAGFDFHINFRNAADLWLAQHGINTLNEIKNLPESVRNEIEMKKSKISLSSINRSDLAPLMSGDRQQQQIEGLVNPKAKIEKKEVEEAGSLLEG